MKLKHFLTGLFLLGGLSLAGCNGSLTVDNNPLKDPVTKSKIADESLSVVSLLNVNPNGNVIKKALRKAHDINNLSDTDIDDIKKVLAQVDTILTNQTGVTNELLKSDNEAYESKMVVTYKDIFNNTSSYTLYFNSEVKVENEDDDDDDDDDFYEKSHDESDGDTSHHSSSDKSPSSLLTTKGEEDPITDPAEDPAPEPNEDPTTDPVNNPVPTGNNAKNFDDDMEQETTTVLKGILVKGDETYQFISVIEEEKEIDEQEAEVHFMLYNDNGFKVKAVHETEIEDDETESKIAYTVYNGNKVVSSYSLEVEQEENDEAEIKLVMDKKKYKIKQIFKNGKEYLKVRFANDQTSAHLLFEKVITISSSGETSIEFLLVNP